MYYDHNPLRKAELPGVNDVSQLDCLSSDREVTTCAIQQSGVKEAFILRPVMRAVSVMKRAILMCVIREVFVLKTHRVLVPSRNRVAAIFPAGRSPGVEYVFRRRSPGCRPH